MAATRPEETGLASGIVNTSYQVGSALGLAMIVALSAGFMKESENTENFTAGIRVAFIAAAAVSAIAFVTTIMKVKKMHQ